MTTPHIIEHNGREYDLTKLEMPIGFLKATARPVFDALVAWPHGWELWLYSRCAWASMHIPLWNEDTVYRAKPAPKKPVIETMSGKCCADMFSGSRPSFTLHLSDWETPGHWIATLEDGKPVRIVWEANK